MTTTTIFENYEGFLNEHSSDLSTPSGAVRMLQDTGMFNAYTDALTEGMNDAARDSVLGVLNRQREFCLEEA